MTMVMFVLAAVLAWLCATALRASLRLRRESSASPSRLGCGVTPRGGFRP
jgi:hypothetical protein